jgi:hypothetical protein
VWDVEEVAVILEEDAVSVTDETEERTVVLEVPHETKPPTRRSDKSKVFLNCFIRTLPYNLITNNITFLMAKVKIKLLSIHLLLISIKKEPKIGSYY